MSPSSETVVRHRVNWRREHQYVFYPKQSSVRHPRAIQRDRSKRLSIGPPDEQVEARLTELIHPATLAQVDAYRAMSLRHRVLTLPVMVAFVLSLIWRQLGSVSEAVRA